MEHYDETHTWRKMCDKTNTVPKVKKSYIIILVWSIALELTDAITKKAKSR